MTFLTSQNIELTFILIINYKGIDKILENLCYVLQV